MTLRPDFCRNPWLLAIIELVDDYASSAETQISDSSEPPKRRIGPYRLLECVGEGGFGVVWLAEQLEPIRRRVALKLIKPGMDSKQVLARFEAERQALAMMNHPGVAKVFDAGVDEKGHPFFAMEFVEGDRITEFCDKQRKDFPERIELMILVCNAVQHAHSKGVIHRDLKPSNILISYSDGKAQPKVIDFGVAKALNERLADGTVYTERGQLIGTPEYMSPEQAEMSGVDVDTRSDIYSLGVLLYELLTGVRPFEGEELRKTSLPEFRRVIREVDPPRPSTRIQSIVADDNEETDASRIAQARGADVGALERVLRKDLDWIVMRCLEKDRERRYDTANGLAMELRRYLDGEPVLAGPPSAKYRLEKFVGRHRVGVLAGALIAATIVIAIVATSVGWARAIRAEALAEDRYAEAERLRLSEQTLAKQLEEELDLATEALIEAEEERDNALAAEHQLAVQQEETTELFERFMSVESSLDQLEIAVLNLGDEIWGEPRGNENAEQILAWLEPSLIESSQGGRRGAPRVWPLELLNAQALFRLDKIEEGVAEAENAFTNAILSGSVSNNDTAAYRAWRLLQEHAPSERHAAFIRRASQRLREYGSFDRTLPVYWEALSEIMHLSGRQSQTADGRRTIAEFAISTDLSLYKRTYLMYLFAPLLAEAGYLPEAEAQARGLLATALASPEATSGLRANAYWALGRVLGAKGDLKRSLENLESARREIEAASWSPIYIARLESEIAAAHLRSGQLVQSVHFATAAIDRLERSDFRNGHSITQARMIRDIARTLSGSSSGDDNPYRATERIVRLRGEESQEARAARALLGILEDSPHR